MTTNEAIRDFLLVSQKSSRLIKLWMKLAADSTCQKVTQLLTVNTTQLVWKPFWTTAWFLTAGSFRKEKAGFRNSTLSAKFATKLLVTTQRSALKLMKLLRTCQPFRTCSRNCSRSSASWKTLNAESKDATNAAMRLKKFHLQRLTRFLKFPKIQKLSSEFFFKCQINYLR